MKTYSFAPISAREYPTVYLLNNPYIWGGVKLSLNVSEKPYPRDIVKAMKDKGIEWIHLPVSETDFSKSWHPNIVAGVMKLKEAYDRGWKTVVHCDFGNNRSRTFIEAFYYLLKAEEFQDEYKGEINHLAYNCREGHLPSIEEVERSLTLLK